MKWQAAVDRAVAPLGLTHTQYSLVASLRGMVRTGVYPSQRELADHTGLDPIFVSKLIRTLEHNGLVERSQHPADSRAIAACPHRNRHRTRRSRDRDGDRTAGRALGPARRPAGQEHEAVRQHDAAVARRTFTRTDETPSREEPLMSQAPTLNGQVIGQTERATHALLDVLLSETDTAFDTWVSLNLLAVNGEMALDALIEQLVTGLRIAELDARATVDDVRRRSLARGTETLRLTDDGRARYEQIREGIDDHLAAPVRRAPRRGSRHCAARARDADRPRPSRAGQRIISGESSCRRSCRTRMRGSGHDSDPAAHDRLCTNA